MEAHLVAAMLDPFFHVCLSHAAKDKEFVAQFDRLTGNNLSGGGTPIERMVDDAVGRTQSGMAQFIEFVYQTIYTKVPKDPVLQ